MRSLRLDPELERRIARAAAAKGESLSEFLRKAAAERADAILTVSCHEQFADVVGAIHGGGGRARRTGDAFAEIVAERISRA